MTSRPDGATVGTIEGLVRRWSRDEPERAAVLGLGSPVLTYGELRRRLDRWTAALASVGLPPRPRIGIMLPPGPESAVALLAACSVAACAPLRPDGPLLQLERDITELELDLVVASQDGAALLRDLDVAKAIDSAGLLASPSVGANACPAGGPADTALLLRTSGTSGQPKRVPLSHAHLCRSADNIRRSLRLTAADRCLNVMPLWHIHGFVAGLLATLAAGGSVMCTPEFEAEAFPGWLERSGATWYSAVPTIHQAVLATLADSRMPSHRLRFIRSASSSLPPTVAEQLEETFGVPVVEAYGMTEAAHQIAANPLPPALRKRGSTGIGTGVGIAVLGPLGEPLAPGTDGEIVIRGDSVFDGYEDAEVSTSFVNDWFRTGDCGHLDADGYLYITGRIKEMINRGGETIAPREIDEVLLQHPDVVDAAAFSVPHERLGEVVAAAVVVRASATPTHAALRAFTAARLSRPKVPMHLVFVDKIPRGSTGKVRRMELERRFAVPRVPGEEVPARAAVASAEVVRRLAEGWARLLDVDEVGPDDSLTALGGDSLLVARMVSRIEAWFGVQVPMEDLFFADTVTEQADLICSPAGDEWDGSGREPS